MYLCDCQAPNFRRIIEQLGAECLECKPQRVQAVADMESVRRNRKPPRRTWARGLSDARRANDQPRRTDAKRPGD